MVVASILASVELLGGGDPDAGHVPTAAVVDEPRTINAGFERRSYRPGDVAQLRVLSPGFVGTTLRIFRCGPPAARSVADDRMSGVAVTAATPVSRGAAIRVGDWSSGLYFARL